MIKPQGKVASWQNWHFIGLDKGGWENLHTSASLFFAVFGIWHIINNFSLINKYCKAAFQKSASTKRESIAAISITGYILLASFWQIPPVNWINELSQWATDFNIQNPEHIPPYEKAERSKLIELCRRQNLDLEKSLRTLEYEGFSVDPEKDSLEGLSRRYHTTPLQIYLIITKNTKSQ